MATSATRIQESRLARFQNAAGKRVVAVFEHPAVVRWTHWVSGVAVIVLIASGMQIFFAFPSFGSKVPEKDLFRIPRHGSVTSIGGVFRGLSLGHWLAGAEKWHFTFMWLFIASGVVYVAHELITGRWRKSLFVPRDIPGVWPMARHYFLFGKKPPLTGQYNPLQKLAYTSTIFFGAISLLSGLVIWKPVQFSVLGWMMGGFHYARIWHFIAMCGFLSFIPGHLLMVAIHGWNNLRSMLTGWNERPEYLDSETLAGTAAAEPKE